MKHIPELDKIFDIESQAPAENLPVIAPETSKNLDQEDDYQLARSTLRNLIYKSENTLDDMIELAKNSEHPRTYEVAGQLIKTVSDVAKDLKDGDSVSAKNVTNNNVVFAGSTAELFKMLKNKDDGKTIEQ